MGRWTQTPSMLIVAPRGSEKLASSLWILSLSWAVLIVTGSVAALLRVMNAMSMGSRIRLSTSNGLCRVTAQSRTE